MTFTVPHVRNDMFFRIRGTNLGYGVDKNDATGADSVRDRRRGKPAPQPPRHQHAEDGLAATSGSTRNPIFVKASR